MTDLKSRLDEIDRLAGRSPGPDPALIVGAPGPNAPDDPPLRQRTALPIPEPDWLNDVPEPASPLAPRVPVAIPDLAVIVVGGQRGASLRGKDVVLTEAEAARVTKVVISALRRSLRDQERELVGLLPKRATRSDAGRKRKARRLGKGENNYAGGE